MVQVDEGGATRRRGARSGGLPLIVSRGRQLRDLEDEAWAAVAQASAATGGVWPVAYRSGGRLVRLAAGEDGAGVEEVTSGALLGLLGKVATWRVARGGEGCMPPAQLLPVMLADPAQGLPELDSVVHSPVYTAGGELVRVPGYSAAGRLVLLGQPFEPVAMSVQEAVDHLLGDWLCDFPFASDASRAHVLALLVALVGRRLISGPLPAWWIDAPVRGAGKSLLAELVGTVALGRAPVPSPWSEQPEERRKRMLAALRTGAPLQWIDNIRGRIQDATLEGVLTSYPSYADRVLGESRDLTVKTHAVWVLTANAATMSPDMARRVLRVRLAPQTDQPELRQGFRHSDIRGWTRRHRPVLLSAVCALVQHWLDRGRPLSRAPLGSFEHASQVLGGILEAAGVPGWLADQQEAQASADSEAQDWRALLGRWYEAAMASAGQELLDAEGEAGALARHQMTPAQVVGLCETVEAHLHVLGDGNARSQATKAGNLLKAAAQSERVFTLQIGADSAMFMVRRVQGRDGAFYQLRRVKA
jgi:hypothetical protein